MGVVAWGLGEVGVGGRGLLGLGTDNPIAPGTREPVKDTPTLMTRPH